MGDWNFGEGVRIEEHIADIARINKRLTSTDLQIVMRERYEQSHGIYDHRASDNPLALVLMNWSEDTISCSTLRSRFEAFLDHRVHERTGTSWESFLQMPTYMCDLILETLSNRKEDHSALNALNNVFKGQNP